MKIKNIFNLSPSKEEQKKNKKRNNKKKYNLNPHTGIVKTLGIFQALCH